MTTSRKTNRDHAKKKHRPLVEDEVIAEQLERLGKHGHRKARPIGGQNDGARMEHLNTYRDVY